MNYMLSIMLSCFMLGSINLVYADKAASVKQNKNDNVKDANKAKNVEMPKDPIILKIGKKEVKFSELMPILINLIGADINKLSKEELLRAIDLAKNMYVMQAILVEEAQKQAYDKKPEFEALYSKAKESVSVDILMKETAKNIKEDELKKAYPAFVKEHKLNDYSFYVIKVADEATGKAVLAGARSGSSFEDLAKRKSIHKSADRDSKPGFIDFTREDYIAREFGKLAVNALQSMVVGEISKNPIKVSDGYILLKFVSKRKAAPLSFSEVKPMIEKRVVSEKFLQKFDAMLKSGKVVFYSLDGKKEAIDKADANSMKVPQIG